MASAINCVSGYMKKRIALALGLIMLATSSFSAAAAVQYDYEMKYLWDKHFDCLWIENEPTFGELYYFQSAPTINIGSSVYQQDGVT